MLINPELFDHVDEMRAFNEGLAKFTEQSDAIDIETPEGLAQTRAMMEPGGPFGSELVAEAQDRVIPGPAGDLVVRVFVPPTVSGVYLSIHGGGFNLGSSRSMDGQNWDLAQFANVVVVSPEYRLAPEHPYPAAYEDCEAVAAWLVDHAEAEFGTARLLIGGESAGATLAATTLLRIRDAGAGIERFRGANLAYGAYDLGMTPSQRLADEEMPLLTAKMLDATYRMFLPGLGPEERRSPDISPLYAQLDGLCSALFTIGTRDPLLDDSVFVAARWELAGNDAALAVYPEAPYGIPGTPTKMGQLAKDRIFGFIAEHARA
jgi:acetyl esterase/lipase